MWSHPLSTTPRSSQSSLLSATSGRKSSNNSAFFLSPGNGAKVVVGEEEEELGVDTFAADDSRRKATMTRMMMEAAAGGGGGGQRRRSSSRGKSRRKNDLLFSSSSEEEQQPQEQAEGRIFSSSGRKSSANFNNDNISRKNRSNEGVILKASIELRRLVLGGLVLRVRWRIMRTILRAWWQHTLLSIACKETGDNLEELIVVNNPENGEPMVMRKKANLSSSSSSSSSSAKEKAAQRVRDILLKKKRQQGDFDNLLQLQDEDGNYSSEAVRLGKELSTTRSTLQQIQIRYRRAQQQLEEEHMNRVTAEKKASELDVQNRHLEQVCRDMEDEMRRLRAVLNEVAKEAGFTQKQVAEKTKVLQDELEASRVREELLQRDLYALKEKLRFMGESRDEVLQAKVQRDAEIAGLKKKLQVAEWNNQYLERNPPDAVVSFEQGQEELPPYRYRNNNTSHGASPLRSARNSPPPPPPIISSQFGRREEEAEEEVVFEQQQQQQYVHQPLVRTQSYPPSSRRSPVQQISAVNNDGAVYSPTTLFVSKRPDQVVIPAALVETAPMPTINQQNRHLFLAQETLPTGAATATTTNSGSSSKVIQSLFVPVDTLPPAAAASVAASTAAALASYHPVASERVATTATTTAAAAGVGAASLETRSVSAPSSRKNSSDVSSSRNPAIPLAGRLQMTGGAPHPSLLNAELIAIVKEMELVLYLKDGVDLVSERTFQIKPNVEPLATIDLQKVDIILAPNSREFLVQDRIQSSVCLTFRALGIGGREYWLQILTSQPLDRLAILEGYEKLASMMP